MSQSRRQSMIEAVINVAVGYGIAVAAQVLIFPFFGIRVSVADNLTIGLLFTIVSLARSYTLRRLFNRWHQHQKLAAQGAPRAQHPPVDLIKRKTS